MRKLGGVILLLVGVIFIGLATLKGLGTLNVLLSTETSTYGVGFIAGSLVAVVLLSYFGVKLVKKGRVRLE
jgi:hypothetical protein